MDREILQDLPGWELKNDKISKKFEFEGFPESVDFINNLVPFLQEMDHHPDIQISYNKILFKLTSHEEGNKVTEKDILVAKEIEKRFNK